jgi:UDP:flavonoid glycosyltransferase YjiC (YdhE family)
VTHKRIILATLGTAGDLHPYLAIARGLNSRGHSTAVGSHPVMRYAVENAQVDFFPVRPDIHATRARAAIMEDLSHPVWGNLRVRRQLLIPNLTATFEDLMEAARGAEVLITGPAIHPAALVAARTGIPWIPAYHAPSQFFRLPERIAANLLPGYGKWRWASAMARPLAARLVAPIALFGRGPLAELYRRHGLVYNDGPESPERSARLILGLFSPAFAPRESWWPSQTRLTGFPLYDGTFSGSTRQGAVEKFLSEGEPPLVFALGSTNHEQNFFPASLEAAVRLKQRAIFLIGTHPRSVLPDVLPKGMLVAGQVPYSTVFPNAAVNVHHGGIGTTALAMKAARPMLVVPRAFDQPDNAARAERLGVARVVPRAQYNARREACDAIEEFLAARGAPRVSLG